MTKSNFTEVLGEWKGYEISSVSRYEMAEDRPRAEVWIELTPRKGVKRRCSGCGEEVMHVHDTEERCVRDLPILGAVTWLRLHRVRVACPDCGPRVEALDWLPRYRRFTQRFEENVARLCDVLPIQHVADYLGLNWKTVKEIDKARLERELGPVDLTGVEEIVMDEFAIQKGHRYATVILEPHSKRVL